MGLPPTGKVVARPMMPRACGCLQEFQHYEVDKYRAQRLAKFQRTRCSVCVAKLEEQQRLAAPVSKGEALRMLPAGTEVTLSLQESGAWAGTLTANGRAVETVGAGDAGPQAVVVALARLWLATGGAGGG
jgi:hypothetical protein